jgi:tubulin-specific chaperone B
MADDRRMLGFYSVSSGMEIHIIDTDPFSLSRNGGLTDVSLVEKYRMKDEDYDKRSGTLRDFIRKKRAEDPAYKLKPGEVPSKFGAATTTAAPGTAGGYELPPGEESVAGITIGARVQVQPGARRGEVKFIGEVAGLKAGHWVGVRFDEPVGLSNGTVKGVQIFECMDGYGGFIRGKNVEVGDFPERDLLDDSDEENVDDAHESNAHAGHACAHAEEEEDEI